MMHTEQLVVALGSERFEVERPWGTLPAISGKVTDVTTDSTGRVFVLTRDDRYADPVRDCVHVLSSEGRYLGGWGGSRIADAHMIACDALDRVWVVDRDCHEIVAFDADGRELLALGVRHRPLEPFNHPSDIAFAPDGMIYVADGYGAGKVHAFDAQGVLRRSWGEVGTKPGEFLTVHGIWVTADNRVLVADRENHRVQVFAADGSLLAVWTGFHRPSDIWGDAKGRVFVSDGVPTLAMLGSHGKRLGRCRPVLNGAHGIWGDAAGHLYMAEGNPSRITRLVPRILTA